MVLSRRVGFSEILREVAKRQQGLSLGRRAFVLVVNRQIYPEIEHPLAQWFVINTDIEGAKYRGITAGNKRTL
ncbi:hypothetical protein A7K93_02425 [Candidatus Methylacidiphilum fumarolicum]|uniref:Uncharacterized protein n=2 Tax=Candidatus Methylacidiphilum fumarolicum TaxID=591154 RepID=I0JVG4_METFB|nr:hypothetical protein [Candidatus Methylacidiphilum fumarolicum]MBW6414864.1 hypothetical protein [Candidatus Methylacidiphilum fumarolicum]TFE68304.1 hypothetical protein A7K73_00780 [Candidatus Methylacidiphilum fumarolicum]TFE73531.1 hypothetical protein A7K72_06420 [Candidatus Methylacidiphilum fumarolicum]TFE75008.1 hypothetical protein A7K93_02425 [Candidatus Methylacidiphilum fumarolicum]TFE76553.1 hypothetical protein A7D33_09430 [Candidatus Methylacidiphilum fumarolicum]